MNHILCSIFIFTFVIGSGFTDDTRIVGGRPAENGQFPYQVSLQVRRGEYDYHFCGGTLLAADVVLTAAHCLSALAGEQIFVWAGNIKLGSSAGKSIAVDKVIIHEQYHKDKIDFDVGILKLKSSFTLSMNIKTIELTDTLPKDGELCTVSGWGTTILEGGKPVQFLRYTEVPIVANQSCKSIYQNIVEITSNMICAGFINGGQDACQGDSGGPLVQNNKIVGIVSFGLGCGRPNIPGVYTNVHQISSWIKTNVSAML